MPFTLQNNLPGMWPCTFLTRQRTVLLDNAALSVTKVGPGSTVFPGYPEFCCWRPQLWDPIGANTVVSLT